MTGMDQHEQAIIAHETMTNGSADAHQKMVESHQKMMGNNTVSTTVPSTSYAAMNEHERAAVAHEFMNNGQSGPHQAHGRSAPPHDQCRLNATVVSVLLPFPDRFS
ncbi:SilE [Klebsiella michiganensis]|nr:SilE [Klebsiella michiganensis]